MGVSGLPEGGGSILRPKREGNRAIVSRKGGSGGAPHAPGSRLTPPDGRPPPPVCSRHAGPNFGGGPRCGFPRSPRREKPGQAAYASVRRGGLNGNPSPKRYRARAPNISNARSQLVRRRISAL